MSNCRQPCTLVILAQGLNFQVIRAVEREENEWIIRAVERRATTHVSYACTQVRVHGGWVAAAKRERDNVGRKQKSGWEATEELVGESCLLRGATSGWCHYFFLLHRTDAIYRITSGYKRLSLLTFRNSVWLLILFKKFMWILFILSWLILSLQLF
jgi:hypothetical protein